MPGGLFALQQAVVHGHVVVSSRVGVLRPVSRFLFNLMPDLVVVEGNWLADELLDLNHLVTD